jgi:hypothetical protein
MDIGFYTAIIAGLKKSAALEKYLETHDDPDVLQTKTAHDQQLFTRVKEAVNWGELASKVMANPVGRGAAYGLGAAIPATAGGAYLIHRAGEESRDTIEDARNKALQTALGVGGIGAGLMALHRVTRPDTQKHVQYAPDPRTGQMVPVSASMSKMSSDANEQLLLEKLATVGFLDSLLEDQEKHADAHIRQDAHECRMLNAEHGVDLLRQLLR